ncbi:MAG: nucleotidyl transferase AbiEii/AbiGii toxin family protein [Bacteroidota bacterium]|nr:nucleotidyl transferase AbiEii/AbiGii toxin family protein [Bacteroidota bacterium]
MENKIQIEPIIAEMLAVAQKILQLFDVDFYIVGAVARDIQFSLRPELGPLRKTNDVDLALMVANEEQFYEIKKALVETGDFYEHETEPIKLFYKQAIELDLLPFGGIENETHEIKLHRARFFAMDMPGFQEALKSHQEFVIDENLKVRVCSLEGMVLLKLFAYNDRPGRTKDVSDIGHIINAYFDLCSKYIYENGMDVMNFYDTTDPSYLSLVAARIIGHKMKIILSGKEDLIEKISAILRRTPTDLWSAMLDGFSE